MADGYQFTEHGAERIVEAVKAFEAMPKNERPHRASWPHVRAPQMVWIQVIEKGDATDIELGFVTRIFKGMIVNFPIDSRGQITNVAVEDEYAPSDDFPSSEAVQDLRCLIFRAQGADGAPNYTVHHGLRPGEIYLGKLEGYANFAGYPEEWFGLPVYSTEGACPLQLQGTYDDMSTYADEGTFNIHTFGGVVRLVFSNHFNLPNEITTDLYPRYININLQDPLYVHEITCETLNAFYVNANSIDCDEGDTWS